MVFGANRQGLVRVSGHETFVCRYPWLPKVVDIIPQNPALFKSEDDAMVMLGVGKNMVRSIRFWAESAQIIAATEIGHAITPFADRLLGKEGHDGYLERPETLWLLHWKIATNTEYPIFYWVAMLNHWHRTEFSPSEAIDFLKRELHVATMKKPSDRTLSDGLRVFINTYVPIRGKNGLLAEDSLDSPLGELGLILAAGERGYKDQLIREPIYRFNLDDKPAVTSPLFAYCLYEYWKTRHSDERTLPFRFASTSEGSPGQIFKLPESSVRVHLEALDDCTCGAMEFLESSSLPQVVRKRELEHDNLLDAIYEAKRS
jgi:hypothetical protein